MVVVIKGAGDIASGIATRLFRAKFNVVMTDIENPTSIRNTVCFSKAIIDGKACIEGITAKRADSVDDIENIIFSGSIAVIADENALCIKKIKPDVVVDAILAKKNIGTSREDAKIVIGIGPGFIAKFDCDAVVETMRGHNMGRVIYKGKAFDNTGVPGMIGGYASERIIRACKDGVFHPISKIGDTVNSGDVVAYVDEEPVVSNISGIVRGILRDGIKVHKGMKSGDVDPRCKIEHCYTCSDKAIAIGGGVLEAILNLSE